MFKTSSGLEIFYEMLILLICRQKRKPVFATSLLKNKKNKIINTNKINKHRFEGRISQSAGARTLSWLSMGKLVAVALANVNISITLNTRLCLDIFTI